MRCVDVNILITAHREDLPGHGQYRDWLHTAMTATEPLGVAPIVESGFIRIVTNRRVFTTPSSIEAAIEAVEVLRAAPSTVTVMPSPGHWPIFRDLCRTVRAKANDVPDAFLAALAIDLGATWVSADRGFDRFPGLRWEHPLEP